MKCNLKKLICTILVLVLALSVFAGCNKVDNQADPADSTESTDVSSESSETNRDELITLDVYSRGANYQGIQSGWFGEYVKKKFNIELNIIAPNLAGGDTLFQTRSAAGSLGDVVSIVTNNGRLADTVEAGLLLDMSEYADLMPNVMQYTAAIEKIQELLGGTDAIYAIPYSVSSYPATEPSESTEPTFGPYIRWDYYTELGCPEMETLEDLLPVLKDMQEAHPETESGQKVYGITLFKDWDDNMMCLAKQPTCFYGYDEIGFVLSKADGTDDQSIIDSDSQYVRALHFYFEANQMGLLDPESTTQTWDTVYAKYEDGAVLYSPWPCLGQAAYNTNENMEAGIGFMLSPVKDVEIFSYGAFPSGGQTIIGIGSNTKYPERVAEFIDWLYSPEGIMMSSSDTGNTSGPEGLTWEMVDGRPELTEFGIKAFLEGDADVPEEWGGGSWADGISQINYKAVLDKDINPETGFAYDYKLWESYIEYTSTPLYESWQEEMGALTTFEYLRKNDQLLVAPGTDYIIPSEPAEISTLRAQCKAIIVENSWKMVYAEDEDEFNSLLEEMQDIVNDLGYEDVLAYDLQNAADQSAARDEARK